MVQIINVALSGAGGKLGGSILAKLAADPNFNVTVLRRPTSTSTFAEGIKVVDVDHTDIVALTEALKGQHTLTMTPPTTEAASQLPLIDAAVAASVYRVVPADFGSNLTNARTRKMPLFAARVAIQEKLYMLAREGRVTYSSIYSGSFLEWGFQAGYLFNLNDPALVDGGSSTLSATSLDTVADAAVGILRNLEATKNKHLRIEDLKITQARILEIARATAPERSWEPRQIKLSDLEATAAEKQAKGVFDRECVIAAISRSLLDPAYGANFDSNDNELVGVKEKGEEYLIAHVQKLLAAAS